MTYTLFILWTAVAQPQPARPPQAQRPVSVTVNCPADSDAAIRAELEAARSQLARTREKAAMPDHAVAALLLSDRPGLTSLVRFVTRSADRGTRRAEIDVYASRQPGETMVAVILKLENPRNEESWEPKEAQVTIKPPPAREAGELVRWGAPVPAAVRSQPERIAPGQKARIVLVFDGASVGLDDGPVTVALLREGEWEFEFELRPSDVRMAPASGGSQWSL